jgi:hypothetical protein
MTCTSTSCSCRTHQYQASRSDRRLCEHTRAGLLRGATHARTGCARLRLRLRFRGGARCLGLIFGETASRRQRDESGARGSNGSGLLHFILNGVPTPSFQAKQSDHSSISPQSRPDHQALLPHYPSRCRRTSALIIPHHAAASRALLTSQPHLPDCSRGPSRHRLLRYIFTRYERKERLA